MRFYQVDAFAERPFEGNPAAVCVMDDWLPDEVMLKVAVENNSPRPPLPSVPTVATTSGGSHPEARSTSADTPPWPHHM